MRFQAGSGLKTSSKEFSYKGLGISYLERCTASIYIYIYIHMPA